MDAWIAIGTVVLLIVLSGAFCKIIQAIIFRLTGDNEKYRVVAAVFMILMLVLAAGFFGVGHAMYGNPDADGPGGWAVFGFYYCSMVAALTFIGLVLAGVGSTVEHIVDAIRGE